MDLYLSLSLQIILKNPELKLRVSDHSEHTIVLFAECFLFLKSNVLFSCSEQSQYCSLPSSFCLKTNNSGQLASLLERPIAWDTVPVANSQVPVHHKLTVGQQKVLCTKDRLFSSFPSSLLKRKRLFLNLPMPAGPFKKGR